MRLPTSLRRRADNQAAEATAAGPAGTRAGSLQMPQLSGARPRAGPVRCNAGIARPPSSRLAAGRFRPAARTTWRSSIVTVRHDQIRTSAASNIPGACAADYLVPAAGQRRPASRRPAPGVPAHHLAASGLTDDLEAVTGELAANAWQHAHTPCE